MLLQANASFSQPVSIKRSAVVTTPQYSSSARPPLPPPPPRRHLLLHHHHAVDDDDVEEALIDMPRTPVTASVIRSSSVPPRLPRAGGGALSSLVGRGGHVTRTGGHVVVSPHGIPVYEKVVRESRVTVRLSKFY